MRETHGQRIGSGDTLACSQISVQLGRQRHAASEVYASGDGLACASDVSVDMGETAISQGDSEWKSISNYVGSSNQKPDLKQSS